ncbi:NAD(P)/FAD-dependent oxidoreductase [Cupriavidus necator]|uniref:NAD(P)/FAD-dependent oxidoreductase n=1 Tax=Cupriavidus necator TaxID=106590 RepID=UPI00339D7E09
METILIIGGGAAGLQLATRLGKRLGRQRAARIVLVDRSPTHLWKPLLHEVATGRIEPSAHRMSFALQARRNTFEFVQAELVAVDRARKAVCVRRPGCAVGEECARDIQTLSYDKLVLAVGGTTQFFGVPGAREHALTLDSVDSAVQVRSGVLAALQRKTALAESAADAGSPQVRVVIVGAGATGVQLAAQIRQTSGVLNQYGVHCLDPVTGVEIVLLEASSTILPGMDPALAEGVDQKLRQMNIQVATGQRVTAVCHDGLTLDGSQTLPADVVVWAAGVAAPPLLQQLSLALNKKGQVRVTETLQSVDDESIYALGDCASCQLPDAQTELPTRAQVAYQQAVYLAEALRACVAGKVVGPFRYRDYGSLVSLADNVALGAFAGTGIFTQFQLAGRIPALLHNAVYQRHVLAIHGWGRTIALTAARGLANLVGAGRRLY